jgi:acyl-CoA synthetase (AMP-forming)/AMP-acid ligase II
LLGHKLMAMAVVKNKQLDSQTILATCAQLMPRYKIPHVLLLVPSLPKTSSGKIDKEKCVTLLSNHIRPDDDQDIRNINKGKGSGHEQH